MKFYSLKRTGAKPRGMESTYAMHNKNENSRNPKTKLSCKTLKKLLGCGLAREGIANKKSEGQKAMNNFVVWWKNSCFKFNIQSEFYMKTLIGRVQLNHFGCNIVFCQEFLLEKGNNQSIPAFCREIIE